VFSKRTFTTKTKGGLCAALIAMSAGLFTSNAIAQDESHAPQPTANIVDTAVAAGSFTTLAAALEATNLISVLADENSTFTVFAPTDDAFAALGQDTIDALLADPSQRMYSPATESSMSLMPC